MSSNDQECSIDMNVLIFNCPHCNDLIQVAIGDLACKIFRHGFFTGGNNNSILLHQIPPHSTEQECQTLSHNPNVIGCCKPFKIDQINDKYYVKICDYI